MKALFISFLLVAPMLNASPTPAETEAHWIATMQKDFREAALVVLADTTSDDRNVIINVREVWKAAPGYAGKQILIPKPPGEKASSAQVKKTIIFFPLSGEVAGWGGFSIEQDRVVLAPSYTLSELRKILNDGLGGPN